MGADPAGPGHARLGQLLPPRGRQERLLHAGQLRLAASDPHADDTAPLEWKDVRRQFTTPWGRWLPITAGGTELRKIAAIPVTRYRYRGTKIPTPWAAAVTA